MKLAIYLRMRWNRFLCRFRHDWKPFEYQPELFYCARCNEKCRKIMGVVLPF